MSAPADEPNGVYKVIESVGAYLPQSIFQSLKFIHIILSKLQNQPTYEFWFTKEEDCSTKGENLTNFGRGILSNFDSKLDLEKYLPPKWSLSAIRLSIFYQHSQKQMKKQSTVIFGMKGSSETIM
jgi:hypothetical protein